MTFKNGSKYLLIILIIICFFTACTSSEGDDEAGNTLDSCSTIGLNPKILNGVQCVEDGPAVVEIGILHEGSAIGICSGALLTKDTVLTAAHCFRRRYTGAVVRSGDTTAQTSQILIHPGFSVSGTEVKNDVAILRLDQNLESPTLALLISVSPVSGDTLSIFGYGNSTGNPNEQEPQVLRSGKMSVSSVTNQHIDAIYTRDTSNTCFGDSGGPALLTTVINSETVSGIVGVTSSGNSEACNLGETSRFANIQNTEILNFIRSQAPQAVLK